MIMIPLEKSGAEFVEIFEWLKENNIDCDIWSGGKSFCMEQIEISLENHKRRVMNPASSRIPHGTSAWLTEKIQLEFNIFDPEKKLLFKLTWQ